MPSFGDLGGTVDEIAAGAKSFDPNQNVTTVPVEHRAGYFMVIGEVDEATIDALKGAYKWIWQKSGNAFTQGLKSVFAKVSSLTQKYIKSVQANGVVNHVWSQGKKIWNNENTNKMAAGIYADAVEVPEGTQLWRWMDDDTAGHAMTKQFLASKPGSVLQNTDSMCTSFHEHWSDTPHFTKHDGKEVLMRIRCANGMKMTPTYATGSLGGEGEFTTLPGQRFVVLDIQPGGPLHPQGAILDVLALPPDDGFVAQLNDSAFWKSFFGRSQWVKMLFVTSQSLMASLLKSRGTPISATRTLSSV